MSLKMMYEINPAVFLSDKTKIVLRISYLFKNLTCSMVVNYPASKLIHIID